MSNRNRIRLSWDNAEKILRRLVTFTDLLIRLIDELSRVHPR
jgi:hypothetical protein